LAHRGYEVHQLFFYRRTGSFDSVPNLHFCARQRPKSPIGFVKFLIDLHRSIRAIAPDVVFTFQHYGNALGALVARLAGVRHVAATQTSALSAINAPLRFANLVLGLTGGFDRVIVNSRETERDHRGYPAPYRRRLKRIDHGFEQKTTELARTAARRLLDLPEEAVILGCVARLHPNKRLDDAVRLLTFDPRWHLALAGQGQEQETLAALAQELGVSARLHLLGERSASEIAAFLAALDVFVFPSAVETFGLAAVEAAQAGVPVLANDLPVLREVLAVGGESCALFVDTADAAATAAAVRRLLEEPRLAASLSARGRRLAERYSLDAMVEAYANLAKEMTSRRS
jgi:glycosyltransferase involved in cell wall biosynthesis